MTERLLPAAAVVLLAVGVAVGAAYAETVLVAAVLGAQVLAAATWHRASGLPGARVGAGVAVAAAVLADVVVVVADDRPAGRLAGVLAMVVLAAIGQQLLRPAPRPSVAASWSATVTVGALCVLGAVHLAVLDLPNGGALTTAAALPAAAVALVLAPPGVSGRWRHPVALTAGLLVAVAVEATTAVPAYDGLLVGAAATGTGWVGAVLARRLAHHRTPPVALAIASVPLLLVAPVAYVLARLLLG